MRVEGARQENRRVLIVDDQAKNSGDFDQMRRLIPAGAFLDDLASVPKPRKGRVISIVSPAGGEGRTTLCANVSAALSRLGEATIAVDADILQRQLGMAMGLEKRISHSLVDVMEGACSLSEACVRHEDIPGLQLLPVARLVKDMAAMQGMKPDQEIMGRVCEELRSRCDFVVIDLPPGYSDRLVTASIAAADQVIIVVMPRWHAVHAAKRLVENVRLIGKRDLWLVVNHVRPEKRQDRDCVLNISEISEILPLDLPGIVPEDDCVAGSSHRAEFAALNSGSPAGREYRNIARRLLGEEVPFVTFKN